MFQVGLQWLHVLSVQFAVVVLGLTALLPRVLDVLLEEMHVLLELHPPLQTIGNIDPLPQVEYTFR